MRALTRTREDITFLYYQESEKEKKRKLWLEIQAIKEAEKLVRKYDPRNKK